MQRTKVLRGDRCQCMACGEYFRSTSAFDHHRAGEWNARHCLDRAQMGAKGLILNDRGFWMRGSTGRSFAVRA